MSSRHRKRKCSSPSRQDLLAKLRYLEKEVRASGRHGATEKSSRPRKRRHSTERSGRHEPPRSKRSLNPRKKNPATSTECRMEGAVPSDQGRSRSRSIAKTRTSKRRKSINRSPSCPRSTDSYDSDETKYSSDSSGSSSSASYSSTPVSFQGDKPKRQKQEKEKSDKAQPDAEIKNNNDKKGENVVFETDKLLMGDITSKTAALGPEIYPGIAERWSVICSEGLSKEERQKIMKKYPAPSNCTGLKAPELNPEIKAAKSMSQVCLKKDGIKANTQNQVGAALTALGQAMTNLFSQKKDLPKKQLKADTDFSKLCKNLCDVGKLLTDVHYYISLTRRAGVSVCVDAVVKKVGEGSKVDDFLFGKDFQEKLKNAQAVDKTSDTISTAANFSFDDFFV